MNNYSGINVFGSLTSKTTGLKISFRDFKKYDADNNGIINTNEFNKAVKELGVDICTFRSIDSNNDKSISDDEFEALEQKILMQECVNEKLKIVYNNTELSKHITEFETELKSFMTDYISNYKKDISFMSANFKSELETKFNTMKNSHLTNAPDTLKDEVLQNISVSLKSERDSDGNLLNEQIISEIINLLGYEADRFISSYSGYNLKWALQTHLTNYINSSDSALLSDSVTKFKNDIISGITQDTKQIQNSVREFLESAVENGVVVRIGNINVASSAAISSAIAQFDNIQDLIDAVNSAISQLKTTTKKQELIEKAKFKTEQEQMQKLAGISGSEYQVNSSTIDWSQVDSRYFNGEEIHERGKGWSGSKDKAYESGIAILNSEGLKTQIKNQIETMLKSKNIPEETYQNIINNIFENIYNQSMQDTLNSEDIITGRGARGWSSKGHAYINVKTLCDTFINTFNTNVVKYVNEMNASYTDFDTIDLDFSKLNLDTYGNEIKDGNGETIKDDSSNAGDIAKSYATGIAMTTRKHGAEYYFSIAEEIIEGLKSQILKKAQTMCRANGIKFDNTIFETIFNNAKSLAVNEAVSGIDSKGKSVGGIVGGVLGAGAVGWSACALGEMYAGVHFGLAFKMGVIGSSTGNIVLGAICGAIALGGLVATSLGRSSECSMNTKLLVDEFTAQFKENYTKWVNEEKRKLSNN